MRIILIAATGGICTGSASAEPPPALAVLHSFPGIDIVTSHNHFIYSHGGPPAKVDHARIAIEVRDNRAHTVSVRSIGIVSQCDAAPRATRAMKLVSHQLQIWETGEVVARGASSVSTRAAKPGRYAVQVAFKELSTTVGCAFTFDVVVDRVRKKFELPLRLEREADAPRR